MNHDHDGHDHHEHTHHEHAKVFEIALKDKKEVAEGTMAFFFEKPAELSFKAGQHVKMILINPPQTDAEGNSRMFSFVNSPTEQDIVIATRMRDTAFKRVLGRMEIGDTVSIENPHGSFMLHSDASKPAVFLIGGIGITPVLSMIKDATERKLPHHIYLFYSNRRPEDAASLAELQELAQQNPAFTFVPTMTEPEKSKTEWQGETGYIDRAMIERYISDPQLPIYYLAGPPSMVAAMKELLANAGVNEDNIRTEEFSGY